MIVDLEALSERSLVSGLRLLARAEALIDSPECWLRKDWAVKADGTIVRTREELLGEATRFCIGGAVLRAAAEQGLEFEFVIGASDEVGLSRFPAAVRTALLLLADPFVVLYRYLYANEIARAREQLEREPEAGGNQSEPEARAPLDVLLLAAQIQDMDLVRFEHVLVCVKAGLLAGGEELARRRAGKRAATTAKNEEAKPSEKKRGRGGNQHDDSGQEAS